jgi:hypothetical protein
MGLEQIYVRAPRAPSMVRKFGERRLRAASAAFVGVLSLELRWAPPLAFPYDEATAAGHLKWVVGGRSVLGVQRDLRETIRRQRKIPRWLERWCSPPASPAREPSLFVVEYAWQ